ncbi:capsular polysaccharide biosynthesis protein [Acinetobacter faecalis]|uniref:capsular polysaccharide biosynthesis protein n=1 Tax=Acinetobacter faecalis TaxID=2665161 RepID=UPI002A918D77|nr:capsular polysaccharide biosynthesis protein [Acinetobacter faecalis]MDY6530933.1 capsular polysaccharide biosynthesis protein [Acinetobacter faecalis]
MQMASYKMTKIVAIEQFVDDKVSLLKKYKKINKCVAGWGRKKSFFRAQKYAQRYSVSLACLEDGFIRSLGLGKDGYPSLSQVVDFSGIYFDALQVSDLEKFISEQENEVHNDRANYALNQIKRYGITKYNQRFDSINSSQFQGKKNIIVVDQTFGDQSIPYAGASADSFKKMLKQARTDHPNANIWLKTHPDVIAGKAQGHFTPEDLNDPNVYALTENYNPIELLTYIDEVYVVSSQLGFEALMCQKTVRCFGVPWYAGWGITKDEYAPMEILQGRRGLHRSLEHLFFCAYIKYARYVSPVTRQRCELEEIIDVLIPNITFQKLLTPYMTAYGFSRWKRKFISDFLAFPKTTVGFKNIVKPKNSDHILAWGKKAQLLKTQNYQRVITVEDGFIRSLGLGASLIRPNSLVFDPVGIYYDATQPSRLENLLNSVQLTAEQTLRAQKLVQTIICTNISKYNVGNHTTLQKPQGFERVILVVGQVEDDMSVQLGGVDIKTNIELLKAVRKNNPETFIIYKPHPDVQARLRKGKISDDIVLNYADRIELDASILDCFLICDEIHTISSLSGFEALLRGIKVYTYGLPFYAGWGLTHDRHQCSRRQRILNLEQLIYVSLIDYPVYNIAPTKIFCIPYVSPECVVYFLYKNKLQVNQKQLSLFGQVFTYIRRLKLKTGINF